MVGEVLADRYEVEELVGAGGMSSVYRANDRLLERKVALKVMHQHFGEDPEYVERFRREARSVAALSHPNVVTVIDRGEHNGRQFIVFEYVDGENLKQLIQRRGPAPVATALELAKQVALALSFAHQQGLVHRDVKPQNVLLNGDGAAKVTDFGIARSLDVKHGMTQTGTVLGTSDYIAPEQAQGQNVDEQTDVYSLGVVLYELLTGEVPFPGESFVAVAMRHINEPPPPIRDRRPDVTPRVEAAVQRAMAKDPRDRFASMGDFAAELDACLAELSTSDSLTVAAPAVARRKSGPSPWPVILAVLVVIAIGAGIGYWALHRHDNHTTNGPTGGGSGGAQIHLSAVTAYDPYGSPPGQENNAEAPYATDGKSSTYWETEHYHSTFAALGKPGVGIVLRAPQSLRLSQLAVATATPGFRAIVKAGDSPSGPFAPVSPSLTVADGTDFHLSVPSAHQYYLLWITQLPAGRQSVQINEIRATSS